MVNLAIGLLEIHTNDYVHNDLSLENILVSKSSYYICDFGSVVKANTTPNINKTTKYIMSPDSLNNTYSIDFSNDIWAFGVIAMSLMREADIALIVLTQI